MSSLEVADGVGTASTISLDSLPIEVFLMICERIDADTLVRSVMYVNKQFYDIISDNYLWKKRAMSKFNNCNVAFMLTSAYNENTFNWKQFAWHTELEDSCWSEYETKTSTTVFSGAHFSEVDAVIMAKDGNHCISASRDRSICLWNTAIDTINNPVVHKTNSHLGWVWDLGIYDDHHFLSCSWDSKIKLWNTDNFTQISQPIQTFSTDAAVLSITSKENFVAAGLFSPKIIAFDPREPEKRLYELLNSHARSIIDLCLIEDNYLISLSEDKTVSVWDLRTNNTVKSMYLSKGNRFPMCASYHDNILFIGDNRDCMYWLDCSHGLYNVIETVKLVRPINDNRNYKLNCIKCTNYGSIVTGGNEGIVYILTPTNPPKVIAKIVDSGSEITSIDYQNDTLVVGYVSSDVQVWKKK